METIETTDSAPGKKPPRHVYALFGSADAEQLKKRVEAAFDISSRLELPSGDWLIAVEAVQASLAFELVTRDGGDDLTFVISRLDRYYGYQDRVIWDWIEVQHNGDY